ncbi:MAG TPA: ATP synthase F0 subunit A [Porphyromonadaceae bacterium]|jgi:F-type H+-transporting ATPase subunit a|uniref:F0F1 ATP synthase subunit A n=1 Tax=Limibacterium fermenti TaxID=3229863 RepID=UPI000E992707|nr:ATP synthase F0 subunit A [Porphyromonadaceae bacterium]HBX45702.1 ATP synthase F0 subunit A [Porphyromonadaceae bacterium]HCM19301.1 ATP synthase F0 subunit A [Porphyromonadaceae bacterium]
MKQRFYIILCSVLLLSSLALPAQAAAAPAENGGEDLNVKEMILEHLADAYEWHIVSWKNKHVAISLPVILYSENSGWNVFMSSQFHHGHSEYRGFSIAAEGKYAGKIVEKDAAGNDIRPWDFSLTKNALSLIISSLLLLLIIMSVARSLKRNPMEGKKGFVGLMEMFILSINEDIIKPAVGKDHARYAPYLLTVFFFIFTNNILGLVPIFPGGANVTGNIAVTMILALCTFFIINLTGTKEYYKDIFWPDVPTWLKVPIPLMPAIELIGLFTKPFALMIRLFANIMAGHSIVLGLTAIIFVTVKLGTTINVSMTVVSVLFTVFINLVELLVAYIQAYVFTMLSAVFIGMARMEPHKVD